MTRGLSVLLCGMGVALVATAVAAPQRIEQAYGVIRAATLSATTLVTGEKPALTFGVQGGEAQLDLCDGSFTQMVEYGQEGVHPTWAAHNNCGGDVILPWAVGQEFTANGDTYVVVELRDVHKGKATANDLLGMQGDINLQTCLYGAQIMRIVGAQRV